MRNSLFYAVLFYSALMAVVVLLGLFLADCITVTLFMIQTPNYALYHLAGGILVFAAYKLYTAQKAFLAYINVKKENEKGNKSNNKNLCYVFQDIILYIFLIGAVIMLFNYLLEQEPQNVQTIFTAIEKPIKNGVLLPFGIVGAVTFFSHVSELFQKKSLMPTQNENDLQLVFTMIIYVFCVGLGDGVIFFLKWSTGV